MDKEKWTVVYEAPFEEWFNTLLVDEQNSVLAIIGVLEIAGPLLGRPYVDTLKNSKINNLKELRVQKDGSPLRAFFAFDPKRQAVFLCGGDKTGDKRFYKRMIELAENVYLAYLETLKDE
jgi:hypothetical protein